MMRESIIRYPVLWFLGLSFFVSWILFGIASAVETNSLFIILGLNIPFLAAQLITLFMKGKLALPPLKTHFIALLFYLLLIILFQHFILNEPMYLMTVFLAFFVADLLAFNISETFDKRKCCYLLRTIYHVKAHAGKILVSVSIYILFTILIYFMGIESSLIFMIGEIHILSISVFVLLISFFLLGPSSEMAFRGFLLPKLAVHISPLFISLVYALLYFIWLMPLYQYVIDINISTLFNIFAWLLTLNIIFTWLFIRLRGSLLVLGLKVSILISFILIFNVTIEQLRNAFIFSAILASFIVLFDPLIKNQSKALTFLKTYSDMDY